MIGHISYRGIEGQTPETRHLHASKQLPCGQQGKCDIDNVALLQEPVKNKCS